MMHGQKNIKLGLTNFLYDILLCFL